MQNSIHTYFPSYYSILLNSPPLHRFQTVISVDGLNKGTQLISEEPPHAHASRKARYLYLQCHPTATGHTKPRD